MLTMKRMKKGQLCSRILKKKQDFREALHGRNKPLNHGLQEEQSMFQFPHQGRERDLHDLHGEELLNLGSSFNPGMLLALEVSLPL